MPEQGRLPDGFLSTYLRYVQKTEVPDYFGLWSALSMIGTCLGRKCFIEYWPTIYPNTYIFLVARSALCRKSTAISQTHRLMAQLDDPPFVLPQKNTTEGIIQMLQRKEEVDGVLTQVKAEGIIMPDELSVFLDQNAVKTGLIPFLTNLWDAQEREWIYYTKGGGKETLIDPCLNILAGTTLEWLRQAIPPDSVGGGFTSRVIFITADRSDRRICWPSKDSDAIELERMLLRDLNIIRRLKGAFIIEPGVKELFSLIYQDFLKNSSMLTSATLSGYAGRRHIMLLKIAMCTSAARSSTMIINEGDLKEAEALLLNAETLMPSITSRLLSNDTGDNLEVIESYIKAHRTIARSDLTKKMSNKMKSHELEEYLQTLIQMGQIKEIIGRGITYQYIGK